MAAGMAVYQDFFSYAGGGPINIPKETWLATMRFCLSAIMKRKIVGFARTAGALIGEKRGLAEPAARLELDISNAELIHSLHSTTSILSVLFQTTHANRMCPTSSRSSRPPVSIRACAVVCCTTLWSWKKPICSPAIMLVIVRVRGVLMRCPQYRAAFCRALITS